MKNLTKILIVIFIASLNCYTSCEDECEPTEIDATTVDVYAWGSVVFIDKTNEQDVTAQYVNTRFRISYYKIYCSGKEGPVLGFDYLSMANGDLYKEGVGSYSFTMQNELDNIFFNVYYIDPDGTERWLEHAVAGKEVWKARQIRFKVNITVNVYSDGFNDLDIRVDYSFLDPLK